MTRYSRKKGNHGYTAKRKQLKVKRRTKDLDEIDNDLEPQNAENLLNQPIDLDVAGAAQHYCLHCARYFIDDHALQAHFRTKVHKRRLLSRNGAFRRKTTVRTFIGGTDFKRLKAMEAEPYTVKEAEAAGGIGTYVAPKKRKMETQKSK